MRNKTGVILQQRCMLRRLGVRRYEEEEVKLHAFLILD
jgi:hypothetical protein